MERKLRINVVCSSRDRRFLVLAEKQWTLSSFRKCTEDVFQRLYPNEPKLKISSIQNEFHFDIPMNYKVDEVLVDAGLVFIIEKEVSLLKTLSQVNSAESISATNACDMKLFDKGSGQPLPRKKTRTTKKIPRSVKIQTKHSERTGDTSSSNTVTSTTSPTLTDQAASLMPQIIEKISEDSEVDIESLDDSITQAVEAASCDRRIKRKKTGGKTASQQLLRKARKVKKKTCNTQLNL